MLYVDTWQVLGCMPVPSTRLQVPGYLPGTLVGGSCGQVETRLACKCRGPTQQIALVGGCNIIGHHGVGFPLGAGLSD